MPRVVLAVVLTALVGACGDGLPPVTPVNSVAGTYRLEACSRGGFDPDAPPPCRVAGTASISYFADSATLVLEGSHTSGAVTWTLWEHSVMQGSSSTSPYTDHRTGTYTVKNDTVYTTISTGIGSQATGMTFTRSAPTFASPSPEWLAGWITTNFDTRLYLRR